MDGDFGIVRSGFEIGEWVWIEGQSGGNLLGERGKVRLECGSGNGGAGCEGNGSILVDCSCEGEGEDAADTLEIGGCYDR